MDVPVNADVFCADGSGCGRSTYVIISPNDRQVTHVVVEKHVFPRDERVVPVNMIHESTPTRIDLRTTPEVFDALPPFVELEYQKGEDAWEHYAPGEWIFSPGALPAQAAVPLQRENVPEGSLALRRGARVEATDGSVGTVADLVVDPVSSEISHVIVLQGGLFNQRHVTLSAEQIDHIDDDGVYLKIDRRAVELLPDMPRGESKGRFTT